MFAQGENWIQKVEDGHKFITEAPGEIDEFYMDVDFHNGPYCIACQQSWCHHCHPGVYEEKCENAAVVSPM